MGLAQSIRKRASFSSKPVVARTSAPTSFAKDLFFGRISSDVLLPFPQLRRDEREFLDMTVGAIQKMASDIQVERIEEERRIPQEYIDRCKEMGLFGLILPEEFGGLGISNAAYIQILASISLVDPSFTALIGAHQSIGLKALLLFGTPEQKKRFLPKLAKGDMIAAFALTEPGAGSDARNLKTTATLSKDGRHYVLNGSKIWITNGGLADFYTVFARTFHTASNGKSEEKITAFIVTRDMPGFSSGPEEKKLGLLGSSTTALSFEDVKVPIENVIGEPGKGFRIALEVLNNGRIGLAGACALGSQKLIQTAIEHALQRKQFGKSLADFGLIQSKISNLAIDAFVAESMIRVTADMMDRGGHDYSLETAMCKVFCTEHQWRTVNETLQIAGGAGYMKEYPYEKSLRDSRIFMIWEGTNEILRLFVGLSGLQGPGDRLREVSEALRKPLADVVHSLGVLREFGVGWVQKRVTTPSNFDGVHPELSSERAMFERYVAQFALSTETTLLKKGKRILEDEFTVKRLADVATDLYAIACTLSRMTAILNTGGGQQTDLELKMVRAFCRKARRRMAENLRRMDKNDDSLEKTIAEGLYERGGYPNPGVYSV